MAYAYNFYMLNSNKQYEVVTEIVVPNTVTEIGFAQFAGFTNVTSISLPSSIKSIGENAFGGCICLKNIAIPNGIITIEEETFYNCHSLTSIKIPSSVTKIGTSAFKYCYRLVEVVNYSNLEITKGSTSNGYAGYYALYIHKNSTSKIENINGCLFISLDDKNYLVDYRGTSTNLTLPNTYNGGKYEIYDYAFYANTYITSITISSGVTSIGDYAFCWCENLKTVIIPENVTTIGEYAFQYCDDELTIYCGASSKPSGWSSKWNYGKYSVVWKYSYA